MENAGMNSSSSVLRCRAAELCQAPFRVGTAQPAPVQAGGTNWGTVPPSHLRAVAVTGVFAGSVHLPLTVFLVTDTGAVADSPGEPQPLCVGLGILFSGKTHVKIKRHLLVWDIA